MNELVESGDVTSTSITGLLFNPTAMQALMSFGEFMSKGAATVPKHLQGKPADCTAIALQAAQWRMNPYAVAQKTHVTQSGALGYEGQLVNAVIVNSGAIEGRPEYEFLGDWDRILGRVEERQGQSGGKYYVAAWKKEEEAGLGVIVRATIRGESSPREIRVMMTQCYPRFSTQWATDPQQQICLLGVRKWARRYTPDAILGVYTPEELGGDVFEVDQQTGEVTQQPKPEFTVKRKPKPVDAEVVESGPAASPASAEAPPASPTPAPKPTRAPAPAEGGEELVGIGEVNFLKNKAKSIDADLDKILADLGGLVLDKLTKADFATVKAELRKLEG